MLDPAQSIYDFLSTALHSIFKAQDRHLFSKFSVEEGAGALRSQGMDVIDISSSETDDDGENQIEFGESSKQIVVANDVNNENWRGSFGREVVISQKNGNIDEKEAEFPDMWILTTGEGSNSGNVAHISKLNEHDYDDDGENQIEFGESSKEIMVANDVNTENWRGSSGREVISQKNGNIDEKEGEFPAMWILTTGEGSNSGSVAHISKLNEHEYGKKARSSSQLYLEHEPTPSYVDTDYWRCKSGISTSTPLLNDKAQEKIVKSPSQMSQKRTLPLSFGQTATKHEREPHIGTQGAGAWKMGQGIPGSGGNCFQQIATKHKSQSGIGYHAGDHFDKLRVKTDESGRENTSARKDFMEDETGLKNKEFSYVKNNKHRILPDTLKKQKPIPNSEVKVSMAKSDSSQDLNLPVKTPYSLGEKALHGFPPRTKKANLDTATMPSATIEAKGKPLMQDRSVPHSRILPPSLMHNKFVTGSQLSGVSDTTHSILGEERLFENNERQIYEEALQNLHQPKCEDDLPEGLLTVPLMKHQKIALAWMVQKEKSIHCVGGILADDQGLGKTISMLSLILKQMTLQSDFTCDRLHNKMTEPLNLDEDEDRVREVTENLKIEQDVFVIEANDAKSEKDSLKRKSVQNRSAHRSPNCKPPAGTLVVCPASVLRQWARELKEKVTDTARLSILIYHGSGRKILPSDLAKYDVVLTTYTIVTNEVPKQIDNKVGEQKDPDKYGLLSDFTSTKKQKQNVRGKPKKKEKKLMDSHGYGSGPLARVRWFRVVLDEAQTIKNFRTQAAMACCGLRAKSRWCLSGTPIQNTLDDLYSYFRFLKYEPYSVHSSFLSSVKFPIARDAANGYKKLHAIFKTFLLRRTKETLINGQPIVKLPPKSVLLKQIDFSPEERYFYVQLEARSREQFKEYDRSGTVKENYASILVLLLRLRQACDHPILVKGKNLDTVQRDSLHMARQLPKEALTNLLLQLDSLQICSICSDPPEDAVVTMCGHVFCYQCLSDHLAGDEHQCPKARCKEILGTDVIFGRGTLESCIQGDIDGNSLKRPANSEDNLIMRSDYVSSKVRAALDILNSLCNKSSKVDVVHCADRPSNLLLEDSNSDSTRWHTVGLNSNAEVPDKAIVFSQWTTMLDLLELSLNQSHIQYRRLDGSMSLLSRDKAVTEFNNDPEVVVMLMSLKAGNLGLNMTAASHVIILDLWWNPFAEDQAVDRAHRIGQTRPVTVSRLTIFETVEDRILALQEDKRKMVSSAFGETQKGNNATGLTMEDLRYLFNV